jgi:hypothetical protein
MFTCHMTCCTRVYLSIWHMPLESWQYDILVIRRCVLSFTIRKREWRKTGLKCRCMWRRYRNLHMTDPAWNLPYDRAWEKAPPYDRARAWKNTCHILGISLYILNIHWDNRSIYLIPAYMLLYTRFTENTRVYDSIYQVYGSILAFMQIYTDDMQVYSCIYNLRALLRPLRRTPILYRELPS